jgi:murein DD-endopeptidase MepM/ murein hydrolase activator NlpD
MKNLMTRGRWKPALALALLLTVGTLSSLPAWASGSISRLRERESRVLTRQNYLQEQIERADQVETGLLVKISNLDRSRMNTEAEVLSLDSDIAALDLRIAATHDLLRASNQRLARFTDELQSTLRKLDARTKLFTARAVATYKAGPTGDLDAMLSSQSFGDLVDTYTYYQSALSEDTSLIDQIQHLRDETESDRSAVLNQQKTIVAATDKLRSDRRVVALQRRHKRQTVASLKSLISQKHTAVTRIESKKAELEQAAAENARESAQVESLLQAATVGLTGPAPIGGGQLLWPAVGPITSPFGWRIHPIFHTRTLHTGIDIGAPYGARVSAADAGTVEYAGTMSGYGNVVVIDHGEGLATLYGHLSAYAVRVGQSVRRGASIANVGCTGYCTGPHLHFEVRLSGQPVDPIPYLQ